jgi:hypothetical protein
MKRRKIQMGILLLTLLILGCGHSFFAEPKNNPVIEDKIKIGLKEVLGTLATTAERRTVIVKLHNSNQGSDIGKFCAEPPPDVAENIVSQIGLLLEAQAKLTPPAGEPGLEGKGKIDFNKLLQTTIQALVKRSQGLQLYRDGMYSYCQSYLNGAFKNDDEYKDKLDELLWRAFQLIWLELHLTQGNISANEVAKPPEYRKTEKKGTEKEKGTKNDKNG